MQTVQTQFRWDKMLPLIRVFTVCLHRFQSMENTVKIKHPPETPKTRNGLIQMIQTNKSTGQNRIIIDPAGSWCHNNVTCIVTSMPCVCRIYISLTLFQCHVPCGEIKVTGQIVLFMKEVSTDRVWAVWHFLSPIIRSYKLDCGLSIGTPKNN